MAYGYAKGRTEYGVASSFPYATTVRIYGEFRNSSDVLVSPTSVTLRVKAPDGTEYTLSPTEESTGIYYYETAINQIGRWVYRWAGTGTLNVAGEFSFETDSTEFPGVSGTSALPIAGDNRKILYLLSGVATPASDISVTGAGTALELGASGATAGLLRFPAALNSQIQSRTADGTADRVMMGYNLSDELEIGDASTTVMNFQLSPSGTFSFYSSVGDQLTIDSNVVNAQNNEIRTTGFVAAGSGGDAPQSGAVRLRQGSGQGVNYRDSGDAQDIVALEISGDVLQIGDPGAAELSTTILAGSNGIVSIGTPADELVISTGLIDALDNEVRTTGFVAAGASGATAGLLRFPAAAVPQIQARTSDGTANRGLILYNASDELEIGDSNLTVVNFAIGTSGTFSFYNGAGDQLTIDSNVVNAQNNELRTTSFAALGSSPATIGSVRLGDTDSGVVFRQSGANITALGLESSQLYIGGTNAVNPPVGLNVGAWFGTSGQFTAGDSSSDYLSVSPTTTTIGVGATTELAVTAGLVDAQNNEIRTTGFIALGADPADTGAIRLSNNTSISAEANPAGTDYVLIASNTNNRVGIGFNSAGAEFYTGSTLELLMTAGVWNFQDNEVRTTGFYSIGSGAAQSIRSGQGSPESVVAAPPGSLFVRTDGGAATSLYVKETGVGNTGWVGK